MTPYELVTYRYKLPFPLYPYQVDAVNDLSPRPRVGFYAEVGTGKTAMSTVWALYKTLTESAVHIVLMPPILMMGWKRWLDKIPGVKSVLYRGTPKQRKLIELDADFVLMSMDIFKIDFEYLSHMFQHRNVSLIVDEATSVKNSKSQNHKRVNEFSAGGNLALLTGTPLSTPWDAYGYCKFIAPGTYRNLRQFERVHVAETDFFGKVTKWGNLELMADNMKINAVRILKREVLQNLPEVQYLPIPYELTGEHIKLYRQLCDEQLLILEDGGKIDATGESKMYHLSQQIIWNPDHFSGKPETRASGFDVLDQVLEQLDTASESGEKLLIYANYKMTIRGLLKYLAPLGAVAAYGEVPRAQQDRNVDRFMSDPTCRVLIAQPLSAGAGLNLQECCGNVFFPEMPVVPKDFAQAVGRVDRDGQIRKDVRIFLPQAMRTIQMELVDRLMDKDWLVGKVQRQAVDLRTAIFGGSVSELQPA
jgi:SNF2 family DNA or RNA helicase